MRAAAVQRWRGAACNGRGGVLAGRDCPGTAAEPRALDRLAGSGYLQTVRVCTFVDRAGEAHVLHAHLKLTPPGAAIDNFGVGLSGSLQCCIDLDSGVPQAAVRLRGCGHGLELVDRHPETGIAFGESPLPYWEEFCEVVKEAAKRFLPVRAIGWDVAITPKGPVVVEGNIWWGPNNPHRNMDKVRRRSGRTGGDGGGSVFMSGRKPPNAWSLPLVSRNCQGYGIYKGQGTPCPDILRWPAIQPFQ